MNDLKPEEVDALIAAAESKKEYPDEIPWDVCKRLKELGLAAHVREGFMRVDESKMWSPEGKLDGRGVTCWGTITITTPAGHLLAQSLKREREAQRKPVARVVIEDVRFHICDGTAFRGAPDDLVMGKSSDEDAWSEHALFGRGFPSLELDPPANERRHYVVVEVYEGWPDDPTPPPEPER